jgi:hypothetical protein
MVAGQPFLQRLAKRISKRLNKAKSSFFPLLLQITLFLSVGCLKFYGIIAPFEIYLQ